jgi:two-component system chemotaxis response regulator CheB
MSASAQDDVMPRPMAVVVGASAGAVDALLRILPSLPANFPLPVMIVVHLPPDKGSILPNLLASYCSIEVKEAEDKEDIRPGTAYLAPPDYHLLVEPDFRLSLSSDEPVQYSRPSIDVLFESAVDAYGSDLVGVVLTGANHDGASGLRKIGEAGGRGLVQSPETAEASAMPHAALEACPSASSMTLEQIAATLSSLSRES